MCFAILKLNKVIYIELKATTRLGMHIISVVVHVCGVMCGSVTHAINTEVLKKYAERTCGNIHF